MQGLHKGGMTVRMAALGPHLRASVLPKLGKPFTSLLSLFSAAEKQGLMENKAVGKGMWFTPH